MGNIVSSASPSHLSSLNSGYLHELQEFEYQKSLSHARFMKTIQFKSHSTMTWSTSQQALSTSSASSALNPQHQQQQQHQQNPVTPSHHPMYYTVKVFIKPQVGISLQSFVSKLNDEKDILSTLSNTLTYLQIIETERCGFLIRQYLYNNLYDRISTQPFLNLLDKKWIAFQMLLAISQVHESGIVHGDIKSQNFLLTTWNWIYLTDFASFKPVYLPEDNPADFSFFFDTSGRRSCYVAPERFYSPSENLLNSESMKLEPFMDIFSLGCTIAELFLEGKPLFTFPQLLKYRKGEYNPSTELKKIEDEHMRTLIESMIQRNPEDRLSAAEYLQIWEGKAFPESFQTLVHPILQGMIKLPPSKESEGKYISDQRLHYLKMNLNSISELLSEQKQQQNHDEKSTSISFHSNKMHKMSQHQYVDRRAIALCFSSAVTSQIRSCQRPHSVLIALQILYELYQHLSDVDILDRVLPFVVCLLDSPEPKIRARTIQFLTDMLDKVESILPTDTNYFPEYIIPFTRNLAKDTDSYVRSVYASCLGTIAQASMKFLEFSEYIHTNLIRHHRKPQEQKLKIQSQFDRSVKEIQEIFQEDLITLMMDTHSHVKRALLSEMAQLCLFFGRQKTNDVILSHIITYLNDPDPFLRASFFEHINSIGTFVGQMNFDEYILPLMMQSITDIDEYVVERVIQALKVAVELRLTQKHKIKEILHKSLPLAYHPNNWIRKATMDLVVAIAKSLHFLDFECFLYPMLRQFLVCDIPEIDLLEESVKEPMSRKLYQELLLKMSKTSQSSDQDGLEIHHLLQQLQVSSIEKEKILALKSYIYRVSMSIKSIHDHQRKLQQDFDSLEHLSTPQTVFLTIPLEYQQILDKYEDQQRKNDPSRATNTSSLTGLSRSNNKNSSGSSLPNIFSRSFSSLHQGKSNQTASSSGTSPTWAPSSASTPALSRKYSMKQYQNTTAAPSPSSLLSTSPSKDNNKEITSLLSSSQNSLLDKNRNDKTNQDSCAVSSLNVQGEHVIFNTLDYILFHKTLELFPKPIPPLEPIVPSVHDLIPSYPFSGTSSAHSISDLNTPISIWKPEGKMISEFKEHKGKVQQLLISPDHSFFASVSEDKTIKIWDTKRLEKNVVNRSRLTLDSADKFTSATFCEKSHAIAYATVKGDLKISKIEYIPSDQAPKYHGYESIYQGEVIAILEDHERDSMAGGKKDYITQLVHGNTDLYSLLIFSTKNGHVCAFDLRSNQRIWTVQIPKFHGYPTALSWVSSKMYVVVGTSLGVVSFWEIKKNSPLSFWQHPYQSKIMKLEMTKQHQRVLISVSGKTNEIGFWDVMKGECEQAFVVCSGDNQSLFGSHIVNNVTAVGAPTNTTNKSTMSGDISDGASINQSMKNSGQQQSTSYKNNGPVYYEPYLAQVYPHGLKSSTPSSQFNLDRLNMIKCVQDKIRSTHTLGTIPSSTSLLTGTTSGYNFSVHGKEGINTGYFDTCSPAMFQPFISISSQEPFLITAGNLDRQLRYWDLEDISCSFSWGYLNQEFKNKAGANLAYSQGVFRSFIHEQTEFYVHYLNTKSSIHLGHASTTTTVPTNTTTTNTTMTSKSGTTSLSAMSSSSQVSSPSSLTSPKSGPSSTLEHYSHSMNSLLPLSTHHQTSITDILQTQIPFPMIISSDTEGVVKVWK